MESNEIQNWIKQARQANLSEEQIKEQLTSQGWSSDQIFELLNIHEITQLQRTEKNEDKLPQAQHNRKNLIIIVIVALIVGFCVYAYEIALFPFNKIGNKTQRFIMAEVMITCYTNPSSTLKTGIQQPANPTSESLTAYNDSIYQFVDKKVQNYGFTSASAVVDYAGQISQTKYDKLMLEISKKTKAKCGVTP
jgi:hypothetical protein